MIEKEYEVVSYNHFNSWIPFKLFFHKKWELKYRLHQYMHNAYCLGVLSNIDAMIVDADLNGVKYIRYKDSKKENFALPEKQALSPSVNFGIGTSFGLNPVLSGAYSLAKNFDCLKGVRHEFGLNYGFNNVEEYNNSVTKNYGFFTANYKYIYSYNLSEYFSSTCNIGNGSNFLFTEIGFDLNIYNSFNEGTQIDFVADDEVSRTTNIKTDLLQLGGYFGLRYSVSEKINFNLGVSYNPLGLLHKDRNTTIISGEKTKDVTSSSFNFNFNAFAYLRLQYKL